MHERASRSESRSPSPPVQTSKAHSKRSTRQDYSEAETLKTEGAPLSLSLSPAVSASDADFGCFLRTDERPHRGRSRAPVPPTAPPFQLDRKPSWRSVSRNRHRRNGSDSSGDDTLVRGNLVDADLDIPAGGEATLLTAKRRASISERSRPQRDDSFDPEQVQQPPRLAEPPKSQTATAVLGSWIKSVGTLLKPDVEPAEAPHDSEADELEARLQRKAERAERRKARAARRAARQTDASAFEGSDGTASEIERVRRSSRRRPQEVDEPRRSRRQAEAEEPSSKPARPALRERAMSFSATLDSGFKNLRESVTKIVSGADDEPPDSASSSSEVDDRRPSRHRADSRKRRENPEEECGPEHQRRRKTVEELPEQRQSRDEERRPRSERPKPADAQRKLRERSRRREVEPEDGQDDPNPRSKSTPVNSPLDDDDALLLRRAKASASVQSKSAIDEDASSLPTRSLSRAAESSSRAARQSRQPPRVDSSPERPSSRRTPRSDAPPKQQATRSSDRIGDPAAERRTASRSAQSSSALTSSGRPTPDIQRAEPADRERTRPNNERERRHGALSLFPLFHSSLLSPAHLSVPVCVPDNPVLRSRPSSTRQSTRKPPDSLRDEFSDEPPPPRRRQVAPDGAALVDSSRSPPPSAFSPSKPLSTVSDLPVLQQQQQQRDSQPPSSRSAGSSRGNLTDEEEESRFAARGSSSTSTAGIPTLARRTPSRTTPAHAREGDDEYLPPIPAPAPRSNRNTLPAYYDSGPLLLRPRPHRASGQQQPRSSGPSTGDPPDSPSNSFSARNDQRDSSSRTSTSHRHHHYETSLPRTTTLSYSRSQPAFDPVSASSSVADSDSDSESSEDEDGEATSDPDSVAFRRRRRHDHPDRQQKARAGDWNDSRRGRSAPSRRFEGVENGDGALVRGRPRGGEEEEAGSVRLDGPRDYDSGGHDDGGDDDDDDDEWFRSAATPSSNRSAPLAESSSSLHHPATMHYNHRRPGDAPSPSSAAASSSSSRIDMFGAPDPPRTTTKSRTMVSSRPPLTARLSDYPASPPETADRGGWRDLQSGSIYPRPPDQPGLGHGSSASLPHAAQNQGAGTTSASFDRLTAKGRESGSVQLFGRHNAPVSRRMARRLGMS